MAQHVTNFGRFFVAFRQLAVHGDPEETRRQLVLQYTGGRTDSLREMTMKEYGELCSGVERMGGTRDELRYRRSAALKLMQELGVDTTDWGRINGFCQQARIAGKPFAKLGIEELKDLATRLRVVKKKGWERREPGRQPVVINILPIGGAGIN